MSLLSIKQIDPRMSTQNPILSGENSITSPLSVGALLLGALLLCAVLGLSTPATADRHLVFAVIASGILADLPLLTALKRLLRFRI